MLNIYPVNASIEQDRWKTARKQVLRTKRCQKKIILIVSNKEVGELLEILYP